MDAWDAEGGASTIHRLAGSDPADPWPPAELARALFGPGSIVTGSKPFRVKDASLMRRGSSWEIYVARGLPRARRNFAIAHELAEWFLRDRIDPRLEDAADALAAAILAPRQAFLPLFRTVGEDLPELAETFESTQSLVALRIGETTGAPTALVTPERVRVRGEAWTWPNEGAIRRLAKCATAPSIRRLEIADQRGRTLLVAGDY